MTTAFVEEKNNGNGQQPQLPQPQPRATPPMPSVINYTPRDWYWFIADDTVNVWSSARAMSVPVTDSTYQDWLKIPHHKARTIASMTMLEDLFSKTFPGGSPRTYAADVRWRKASGGVIITSISPVAFSTDVVSRNGINSGYDYLTGPGPTTARKGRESTPLGNQPPSPIIQWKMSDGSFIPLDKNKMTTVMNNVSDFVQDCFAIEQQLGVGIDAGTITTLQQVDDAFAALSNTYTSLAAQTAQAHEQKRGRGDEDF